ncbi:MAG TPA: ABC transporter ATPase [Flavobacteriales bacterium]|nr:ABC transporter ATPase [Flavobacteriales bacterium]
MLRSFDELPDHSRVWIYMSDRPFSLDEEISVQKNLENFIQSWSAHGNDLAASARIEYSQIIVIALDERQAQATGCSIDKQFHLIQSLESELGLSLLDRMNIALLDDGDIDIIRISDIDSNQKDRIILDNTIQDLGSFRKAWRKPAYESWMARLF